MVSPCLEATYGVEGRCGPVALRPYIEETLIILPRPSRIPKSLETESAKVQPDLNAVEKDVSHSWSTIMASSSF